MSTKTVLFLCTGNYYRSRFAEIVFNHKARVCGLDWRADSRGLARVFGAWNVGQVSQYAAAALRARGIEPAEHRCAMHCGEADLQRADLIVALKEVEHRPLLVERFPGWSAKTEFWHIHDVDQATPEQALPEIERLVEALVERLQR
jgi:protein-tyrosine phosphatase